MKIHLFYFNHFLFQQTGESLQKKIIDLDLNDKSSKSPKKPSV